MYSPLPRFFNVRANQMLRRQGTGFPKSHTSSTSLKASRVNLRARTTRLAVETLEKRRLLAADFLYGQGGGSGDPVNDRVPGEIIIQFTPGADPDDIRGVYQANEAAELSRLYGQGRVRRISVPAQAADSVLKALSNNPFVEYAEPNFIASSTSVPNDPFLPYQWNFGADSGGGINLQQAWTQATGTGVTIAVLDTGVAYENYSDASGQYFVSPDLAQTRFSPGYDFINDDGHANDDQGHGTHVAGTIAQSSNNGIGVAGVAYNATIMPVKVLGGDGSGSYASIASGIRWAADQGADVINLSLGGSNGSTLLRDALAYAYDRGVTIVAAAGNDGVESVSFPAAYDDYVIAVSATRYDKQLASYSNYGDSIDIAAPGGDVTVDQNNDGFGDGILQSTFAGAPSEFGYYFYQGTSMAAPHVAGVAGLIVSLGVTDPVDVRQILVSTATDLGTQGVDRFFGYGLLDAAAAVNAATQFNKDPSAQNDNVVVLEDEFVVFDVLENDTDPDGDTLSVISVGSALNGVVEIQSDGRLMYQPNADFHGTDQFQYTIADGKGGTADGTIEVQVDSVADVSVVAVESVLNEGNSGFVPFRFELQLDESAVTDLMIDWAVDGYQTTDSDFVLGLPAGSTLIAAGSSKAVIEILVAGDETEEPNETFNVEIASAPAGIQVSQAKASGTILNDDGIGEFEYFYGAIGEVNTHGLVANSHEMTDEVDNLAEVITEEVYQRNRRSRLEHAWDFELYSGDLGTEFVLVAGHDSDVESFLFEYNLGDGLGWRTLLDLSEKAIRNYSVPFAAEHSGLVSVRVVDSNRQMNESVADRVFVDQIGFVTRRSTPLPPIVVLQTLDGYGSELGSEGMVAEVSIDRTLPEDLSIFYQVTGTASPEDYLEDLSGTVIIPAGNLSARLLLTPVDDELQEGTESIILNVLASELYSLSGTIESQMTIYDDDRVVSHYFPSGEGTESGVIVTGDYSSLQELDGSREVLSEISSGGRLSTRKSYLDHRWSFVAEDALSFEVNAYRPSNSDDDDFVFQLSSDAGATWLDLVTIQSDKPSSYSVQLLEPVTGDLLVRVVDTDPNTRGNGDRDILAIDKMFFSTDVASAVSASKVVDTVADFSGVLKLGRSTLGVLSIDGPGGVKSAVRGKEFRTVVKPGQVFENDHSWRTERIEIRDGKLVQIASDGNTTMIVEGGGWKNFVNPSDVNNDQLVSSLDVLAVVNEMTRRHFSERSTGGMKSETLLLTERASFFDQNGDGICSALDALRVINDLTRKSVVGESEMPTDTALFDKQIDSVALLDRNPPEVAARVLFGDQSKKTNDSSVKTEFNGSVILSEEPFDFSRRLSKSISVFESVGSNVWTGDLVDAVFVQDELGLDVSRLST